MYWHIASQSPSCRVKEVASSGRCPTGERGEEKVRPSAVAVLQQFTSHAFNKCYVGNVIHRRLHCVIFSPVQSIPNAVRATRPLITLMAVFGSGREVTGPLRVCSHIALARPPSADDERTTSVRNKRRTATTNNDAPARCCPRRVAQ